MSIIKKKLTLFLNLDNLFSLKTINIELNNNLHTPIKSNFFFMSTLITWIFEPTMYAAVITLLGAFNSRFSDMLCIIPDIGFFFFTIMLMLYYFPYKNLVSDKVWIFFVANKYLNKSFAITILLLFLVLKSVMLPKIGFSWFVFIDLYTITFKFLIILSCWASWHFSKTFLENVTTNIIEYPIFLCFATGFLMLLISSYNLFGLFLALEGLTLTLYVLAAFDLNSHGAIEAGVKYLCLGAVASGLISWGILNIHCSLGTLNFLKLKFIFNKINMLYFSNYSNTMETEYFLNFSYFNVDWVVTISMLFILFGFFFKISAFPYHIWTPDVYEGCPGPITAFFAITVKLGIFAIFLRILNYLFFSFSIYIQPWLILSAIGSMIVGCFGALVQTKIKRFIAYTSINQMGFLLMGLSCFSFEGTLTSIIHLFVYLIMNTGFFCIILNTNQEYTNKPAIELSDLEQYVLKNKTYAYILIIILFSMAGIPPLAGFFSKFYLFIAVLKSNFIEMVLIALIVNIVSAFYYIRIIKCLLTSTKQMPNKFNFYFIGDSYTKGIALAIIIFLIIFVIMQNFFFLNFCEILCVETFAPTYFK